MTASHICDKVLEELAKHRITWRSVVCCVVSGNNEVSKDETTDTNAETVSSNSNAIFCFFSALCLSNVREISHEQSASIHPLQNHDQRRKEPKVLISGQNYIYI